MLSRLDLRAHLPPFGDRDTVDTGHALHARVLAALSRPILHDDGTLLGTAGHLLLNDLAVAAEGGASVPPSPLTSPTTSFGGSVPWMHRAQVVFHVVDSAGKGWVDADECEALARAFLTGAGGAAEGALREYLEDLSGEGAAMVAGAAKAEAAAMMEFAEDGRLTLKGFARWLAAFMESLEEDAAADEVAGAGASAGRPEFCTPPWPPPKTPAGEPPYSLTPAETTGPPPTPSWMAAGAGDEMDEGGDGGGRVVNFSVGSLGSGATGAGEADVSAEEARAVAFALAKEATAAWEAAHASEPQPAAASVWASGEPTAVHA